MALEVKLMLTFTAWASLYICAKGTLRPQNADKKVLSHVFLYSKPNIQSQGQVFEKHMHISIQLLCLSTLPAAASILATLPLWYFRGTNNETIRRLGGVILFAGIFLILIYSGHLTIMREEWLKGFLCIPCIAINILVFNYYNLFLYLIRCPLCHKLKLRTISRSGNCYKLVCRCCRINMRWRA